ncbi:related to PCF11 component of pre-mRNA 3`-end processing factor CF I [Rhynchosporium agropyri]|uniref:Related to PCF11 component of pre-mRNA 3`-end processing factor CF I n=1 Tax=Rhynchosporium agropyri TaxID=914238 RepID=A0A1E1JS74_9HELO|nr:related to PCF11 component of pre-mRNA 3`-end processing factor CF I [Rhynchosporium agropyri]
MSDEVADDFAHALNDLSLNSRYEISNLTVIARENTASSLAIAEVLKNHIKQVAPTKKLPAFYVLDSIVKNVGTPYTLFFGRDLFSVFMDSYARVDNNTRSKMVEMLRTWKEPVPGSMDTRPVFSAEVTRPIENALIKARTSFLQAHQEHTRGQSLGRGRPQQSSSTPYRETPTPPNLQAYQAPGYPGPSQQAPGYQTPGYQAPSYPSTQQMASQQPTGYPTNYNQQQYSQPVNTQQYSQSNGQQYARSTQPYNQPTAQQPYGLPQHPPSQQYSPLPPSNTGYWQQQQPPPQGQGSAEDGIAKLNNDIEKLIASSRAEWPQNPHDTSIGTKLKALLDLQTILQSQKLPPDQISLIKDQVAQLSRAPQPAPKIQSPPIQTPTPVAAAPVPAQQPTLSSLLGPGALAALLARSAASTPPMQGPVVRSPPQNVAQPSYQLPSSSGLSVEPMSLLDKLRAAGVLPSTPTPISPASFTPKPAGFPSGFPPPFLSTPPLSSRTPLAIIPNDVVLKATSLKIPRPHLISSLYEGLGAPCTQCGRRFQSDPESKKKKAAHMDWHFHVRQRVDEAEARGQHRSWYVDELDWIKSREVEGESGAISSEPSQHTAAVAASTKLQYLPVPDDPALANSICPICQEKFEMKWLDEAQEFVWMDATNVGGRIYHASCYAEAAKDVTTEIKRGTPEPAGVLGKRKAEDDQMAFRAKIKSEPGI